MRRRGRAIAIAGQTKRADPEAAGTNSVTTMVSISSLLKPRLSTIFTEVAKENDP
jgi:hypothetical protein